MDTSFRRRLGQDEYRKPSTTEAIRPVGIEIEYISAFE